MHALILLQNFLLIVKIVSFSEIKNDLGMSHAQPIHPFGVGYRAHRSSWIIQKNTFLLNRKTKRNSDDRLPSTYECVADQYNYVILKGCLCYLFQSTGLSTGSFRLPPEQFLHSKKVTYLIFTFVGDLEEIVRVVLKDLYLGKLESNQKCDTYLRVFTQLDRAELNQNDVEQIKLCQGNSTSSQDFIFYSTGRVLLMELYLSSERAYLAKLKGTYEFVAKGTYRSDGVLISSSVCDRLFLAPDFWSGTNNKDISAARINAKKSGKFFSPQYPQNYPSNLSCEYYFLGSPGTRVVLNLESIALAGDYPCRKDNEEDRLEIYENESINTSVYHLNSLRRSFNQRRAYLCSGQTNVEIVSNGSAMMLRFIAVPTSSTAQGFEGKFRFAHPSMPQGMSANIKYQRENFMELSSDARVVLDEEHVTHQVHEYIHHIWKDKMNQSGIIKSPNYPESLPRGTHLWYIFHIPPENQLRIKFLELSLWNEDQKSCSLKSDNRIEFRRTQNLADEPILLFCGDNARESAEAAKLLYDGLLSTGPYFVIYMTVNHHTSRSISSFYLQYVYENPSVDPSAFQSPDKLFQAKGNCTYTIQSNGRNIFGNLPIKRYLHSHSTKISTERINDKFTCRWQLKGNAGQRIKVKLKEKRSKKRHDNQVVLHARSSSIQHDEQRGTTVIHDPKGPANRFPQTLNPLLRSFGCPGNSSLELINYQRQMHMHDYGDTQVQDRHASFQDNTEPKTMWQEIAPADPVRICPDGSFPTFSNEYSIMSGEVPRIDVILQMGELRALVEQNDDFYSGYDVEYQFVTDYGVHAPAGVQRVPACYFEFDSSRGLIGNFSSPNYPGSYPIELTCQYKFYGSRVQKITINFTEFDVESASKTCTDDNMGDYLELTSCYPIELLRIPKRRLCHHSTSENPLKVAWPEPCLLLRFFSNSQFVGRGFFGTYIFHNSAKSGFTASWMLPVLLLQTMSMCVF